MFDSMSYWSRVKLRASIPRTSLTSTDANSQDKAGKLQNKIDTCDSF
ncbi:hypothetical protein HanXRQr2_Chr11g0485191 [Helianthus annuus]|uniref:Uncharacterized protein n=1 Tax=Helianthus annuus TaxID=4232 RepID=A0A9K3MZN8_HELAN|nr:hypothetical protein HanXRQr2_Chr11g0485191 [Helianthus annuus]KAJ0874667.1 hypothetical protein HanPSC8_Chr11g0466971 [Helianthus annuus]